jgi:hypothetical protein
LKATLPPAQAKKIKGFICDNQAELLESNLEPPMDLTHLTAPDTPLAIIGLGYVGLPLAVEFGKQRPVVGFDIKPAAYRSSSGAATTHP